ncbi:GAF domain-containing sensor histidine kinase [Sporosarcina sp. ITBMC105]
MKSIARSKEFKANVFIIMISIIGCSIILHSSLTMTIRGDILTLLLFILFIAIAEYFPMPVWKGFSSISFPLLYAIHLIYGTSLAIVIIAGITCLISIVKRRPLRIIFFNPAQLAISLSLAVTITNSIMQASLFTPIEELPVKLLEMFLLTSIYYLTNNIIVDGVLLLRPQKYDFVNWKQKTLSEIGSLFISLLYSTLLLVLGSQNRGIIDTFSFFFFFSPLIGLALLTSIIVRIKTEKNRLKSLFNITSELNRLILSGEVFNALKSLKQFIDFDSAILWINNNGAWERVFEAGELIADHQIPNEDFQKIHGVLQPTLVNNRKNMQVPFNSCFPPSIRCLIYTPLLLENRTIGLLIVGRIRPKSFTEDDVRSVATLSNQLAIAFKTRSLLDEQERRLILEERNRIARDIHDGIAQTLAGAIMKLETATKKQQNHPIQALELMTDSIEKLRGGLREVRESIYALRPYPTEQSGLSQSIDKVIREMQNNNQMQISLEERGQKIPLSPMVEKVIFDIFKESMQNISKHANAKVIQILISYQSEQILLKVKDDGCGFSLMDAMLKARHEPHFGIINMNEAASKIKATLQFDSKPGQGTEITLTIPKLEDRGGHIHDQSFVSG